MKIFKGLTVELAKHGFQCEKAVKKRWCGPDAPTKEQKVLTGAE
jgi:hypothetical protein